MSPDIEVKLCASNGSTRTVSVVAFNPSDHQRAVIHEALAKNCQNVRLISDTNERLTYLVDVDTILEVDAPAKVAGYLNPHIFRDCAA